MTIEILILLTLLSGFWFLQYLLRPIQKVYIKLDETFDEINDIPLYQIKNAMIPGKESFNRRKTDKNFWIS